MSQNQLAKRFHFLSTPIRLGMVLSLGLGLTLALLWLVGSAGIQIAQAGPPERPLFAPAPVGTDPISNALNVPVTSSITIFFNEQIEPTSVNSRTFAVYGSQSPIFLGAYMFFDLEHTVALSPERAFFPGEQVHTTVTTGTLNTLGQNAISATVWQFWAAVDGGSGQFPTGNDFGTGSDGTHSLAFGDVDGDGDLDLAVGDGDQNVVYFNDGDGTFAISNTVGPSGAGTEALTLGDMNADGDLDLVLSRYGWPNIVYINDGTGDPFDTVTHTFGTGSDMTRGLAWGDLDGDGDLDLAIGNSGLEQDVVYFNDGDGTFDTISRTFESGISATWDLALGDVDGDSDLDIAVANAGPNVVYLNDGDGTFDTITYTFGTGSDTTRSLALGDLDGDGDLDIAVGNESEQNVVYLNDGDGTFDTVTHTFGTGSDATYSLAMGDVDADGDLDLAVGDGVGQNVIYLSDGAGNPFDTVTRTFGTGSEETGALTFGDVDGDGDLDLAAGNFMAQNVVYLNQNRVIGVEPTPNSHSADAITNLTVTVSGAVSQTTVTTQTVPVHGGFQGHLDGSFGFGSGFRDIVFDPDSELHPGELVQTSVTTDVVINTLPLDEPYVWQFRAAVGGGNGVGSGVYMAHPISPTFDGGYSTHIVLGDLDGDSDLDAVVANFVNQAETVWLNDGTGGFAPHPTQPSFGNRWSLAVALGDIDGDGDLDAVVANSSLGGDETVWLNDGVGVFTPHPTRPSFDAGYAPDVALGDVDDDGDLDAVFLDMVSSEETVWLNDGAGVFSATSTYFGVDDDNTALALGDLDGDSDLDVVIAVYSDTAQTVWLNNGTGNFAAHPTTPTFGSGDSKDVALGDIDADGDLDALVANFAQSQTVWLNDGSGVFTAHPTTPSFGGEDSEAIALGDLDGDGDLDAVVANYNNQAQTVWLNDGVGNFAAHPMVLGFGANNSRHVALGDLDGDGDLDVAISNYDEQNIVYLNENRADLEIVKAVTPASPVAPGQAVTYTLAYTNYGPQAAVNVVVSDAVPISVTNVSYSSSCMVTPTGSVSYTWLVGDLAVNEGGVITVTGVLTTGLHGSHIFTNTAVVTAALVDADTVDNHASAEVTVANIAPVATDDSDSTDEDVPLTLCVLANDTDANGDTLSVSAVGTPGYGTAVVSSTTQIVYTPALNFHGTDVFTYTAFDGSLIDAATVTVTANPVNDAPAFTSTPITAAMEGVAYTCPITAADVDVGDALTFTTSILPEWLSLADHGDGTGTITGAPAYVDVGDHAISLQVRDTAGLTATQTFTVTVREKHRIYLPLIVKNH